MLWYVFRQPVLHDPMRYLTTVILLFACLLPFAAQADHKVTPQQYMKFQQGKECFARGDFDGAFTCWLPLAEQGIAEAQYNIGRMYAYGEGLEQDYAEAYAWFLVAAQSGRAVEARKAMTQLQPHMSAEQISTAYRRAEAIKLLVNTNRAIPAS